MPRVAEVATAIQAVRTDAAPAPIGPYNQAVRVGSLLFCSGQIPIDPATGEIEPGDVAAQTDRVMRNIAAVLTAAGTTLERVVKTTIYLVDMADFAAVNAVYGRSFAAVAPARSTVAVSGLPRGVRVEIEVLAAV